MKKVLLALLWSLPGLPLLAQNSHPASADTTFLNDRRLASVPRAHLEKELQEYNQYMDGAAIDPPRIKSFILVHPDYYISLLKFGELVQAGLIAKPQDRFDVFPPELKASLLGRWVL
ncbi:MAG TPA: hypothetical protein VI233_17030, partial [Puia sp.]